MTGRQGWNLRAGGPDRLVTSGSAHYAWKGDAASEPAGRARARRAYSLGPCTACGERASDRHHVDGDTLNNDPSNVVPLCRRCHMERDGRMASVTRRMRTLSSPQPPKPCRNCGWLYNPMRHGRCVACAAYFTRTGSERPQRLCKANPRSDAKRRRVPC